MPHPLHFLLLADIGELLGSLVGLVMLVLWVIKQIVEAKQQAPPAQGRKPIAPRRPQPAGGGAPNAGQQADPLRSQVEEFLRRAGRGPQGDQADAPHRPQAEPISEIDLVDEEIRPLADPRIPAQESSRPGIPQPGQRSQPIQKTAKPRRAKAAQPRKRETLAERAAQREGERARRLAEQTVQLGQRIIADDKQFDVQIQAKFDHAVGTLAGTQLAATSSPEAPRPESPAAQIAAMLASPEGVRQAIILNEILRRPSDRW